MNLRKMISVGAALVLATPAWALDCNHDGQILLQYFHDYPHVVYSGCENWDIPAGAVEDANILQNDTQGIGCTFILSDLQEKYGIEQNQIIGISKYAPPLVGTIKFDLTSIQEVGNNLTTWCRAILTGTFDGVKKGTPYMFTVDESRGVLTQWGIDSRWNQGL